MSAGNPTESYVLGTTDAERGRLMRQAALFAPFTERLLRDAGVAPGMRVLDIGSGLGDVAMMVARLVGPSGRVVGVDRDAGTLAKARARLAAAGVANVTLIESDVGRVQGGQPFDAVVGRLILEFVPDPGAVVRALVPLLRPGGVLALQDAYWQPLLAIAWPPLRARCATFVHQTFARSGANMDMELVFWRTFQDADLPAPTMRIDVPIGGDPDFSRWLADLATSLVPSARKHGVPGDELGDLATLQQRLETELAAARAFGATIGLVGAWARKPPTAAVR